MTLRYHQPIFDMVHAEPQISEERLEQIRALEQRCGVLFPAAIVEWFALENGQELFEEYTAPEWLVSLSKLGKPKIVQQGYLHVADENQGVVAWFAKLDGSDDPPVFDNRDAGSSDLSQVPWERCSPSFSAFIRHMIGVYETDVGMSTLELSAEDQTPDAALLDRLHERYTARHGWPKDGERTYRFFSEHGRITFRERGSDEQRAGTASWHMEAPTPESLLVLARDIWDFGTLSASLSPKGRDAERRAREEAVLQRLREARQH